MGLVEREREQGFMLLGLIVAIFLILLALGVAAPKVARELRREREVETVHRGDQYVRAIRLYYKKFGHYPGSIEQLEKTNNIRFLRQQYVDPLTGKADWRLIHVGEAKTTVKGFFGKPLTGLTGGLGSMSGMASPGASSPMGGASSIGTSMGGTSIGSPLGGTSIGSPLGGASPVGGSAKPTASGAGTTGTTAESSGTGSSLDKELSGTGGPFVGVGLVKDGDSVITLNEQTTYPTWEFIYDPRIEQMYAKSALMGAGTGGSTDASQFGAGSTSSSPFGGSPGTGPGSSTTPTPGTTSPR